MKKTTFMEDVKNVRATLMIADENSKYGLRNVIESFERIVKLAAKADLQEFLENAPVYDCERGTV